jgi:hypothetical protein
MLISLPEKINFLSNYSTTFSACLISGELTTANFTVTGSTLNITGHGFIDDCGVMVSNSGGGLPDGLDNSVTYYVVNSTENTLQLSEDIGGNPVAITSVGSGTHSITEIPLINTLATHASNLFPLWVRHEVNLPRVNVIFSSPVLDSGKIQINPFPVTFAPLAVTDYRYFVLIRGGNLTFGNSTGEIVGVIDDGENSIGIDGKIFNIGAIAL